MPITEKYLTRKNENVYKQIFKMCFDDSWKTSIPFVRDPIFEAQDEAKNVTGFCMVHSEPPYQMKYGPAPFLYNLCVDPKYRKQGVATSLLCFIAEKYGRLYSHMLATDPYHEFMTKNGWKRIGVWREKFVEYCYGFDVLDEFNEQHVDVIRTPHYDPDENVVYLS